MSGWEQYKEALKQKLVRPFSPIRDPTKPAVVNPASGWEQYKTAMGKMNPFNIVANAVYPAPSIKAPIPTPVGTKDQPGVSTTGADLRAQRRAYEASNPSTNQPHTQGSIGGYKTAGINVPYTPPKPIVDWSSMTPNYAANNEYNYKKQSQDRLRMAEANYIRGLTGLNQSSAQRRGAAEFYKNYVNDPKNRVQALKLGQQQADAVKAGLEYKAEKGAPPGPDKTVNAEAESYGVLTAGELGPNASPDQIKRAEGIFTQLAKIPAAKVAIEAAKENGMTVAEMADNLPEFKKFLKGGKYDKAAIEEFRKNLPKKESAIG